MRIVVDLQAAQAENRFRGIGRLALSLTQAIVRQRGDHEVIIVLNGAFPASIPPIREAFKDLLPAEGIQVWFGMSQSSALNPAHSDRREASALIRDAFISRLEPSILLVTSLFEGFVDGAVTTVKTLSTAFPTAVILYDLIPLLYQDAYLKNPVYADWYFKQLEELKKADLLLSISDSSRQEAIHHLGIPHAIIKTIYAGKDDHFFPKALDQERINDLKFRFRLDRPYVLYGGGIDFRKNIEGLIRAFSGLPRKVRDTHQLAIVCSVSEEDKARLEALSIDAGLAPGQFVMTGYVAEEDLVDLYRMSKLFVFPSLHEGFGLPALEAMACGIPVIGSNNSSLPEVIGYPDALFDAKDNAALSQKIEQVLTREDFQEDLKQHALMQARQFSWERSARLALSAMEEKVREGSVISAQLSRRANPRKLKMAYLSPLQPQKSGIADYSADLLESLAPFYDIDVITDAAEITDPWAVNQGQIRSIRWFKTHFETYDRVIYHFGNSSFHSHMFDLLPDFPGVVVLHDFFLSGIIAHRDLHESSPGSWAKALYISHGYKALGEWEKTEMADLIWNYPANLEVLQSALGLIVHSEESYRLIHKWYGCANPDHLALIPLLRIPATKGSQERFNARKRLGISTADILICSFGLLGPSKLNHRLIDAFANSSLSTRENCQLVFVGQNQEDSYGLSLLSQIRELPRKGSVRITGWADPALYKDYLAAADIGVQLRTLSRGETSASVLDCMNHGLAVIVNANGSMADIPDSSIVKLEDEFTDASLVEALEHLVEGPLFREQLGSKAQNLVHTTHEPQRCADLYHQAIEAAYLKDRNHFTVLPELFRARGHFPKSEREQGEWAQAIASSFPPRIRAKQLLVDISELVQRDARTGIQRVVRSILQQWLCSSSEAIRIEPVYATEEGGYRYARRYTLEFIQGPNDADILDEPVDFYPGDCFLGLDLQPSIVRCQRDFYQTLRNAGVKTGFVIYDLLCVRLPHTFPPGAADHFRGWLEVVADSDHVVCISKAVADDFSLWLSENHYSDYRRPRIDWFPLGSDIENSSPSLGVPDCAKEVLKRLTKITSFLMVGTLEPRKAHTQALDAFELLWSQGEEVALVIVGKQGWMVDALVDRLRTHPELGRRLFWLEGISDQYLDQVMKIVRCLLAPSLGEGFGLPLIEASRYQLPILARDIPVFREVAGAYAHFFSGETPTALANAIQALLLRENRRISRSREMTLAHEASKMTTWAESADRLLSLLEIRES